MTRVDAVPSEVQADIKSVGFESLDTEGFLAASNLFHGANLMPAYQCLRTSVKEWADDSHLRIIY